MLQVNKLDASTRTITFGVDWYCCIKEGSGVLDLRGTVITVDGVAYDKKSFSISFGQKYSGITEFYADNVVGFGKYALQSCSTLTTASITGTFASIGEFSFSGCSSLTNVVLNSPALATIGGSAFQESKKVSAIEITSDLALTVNSTAMQYTGGSLTSLTVNGPAWTQSSLDNLLTTVAVKDGTEAKTANKPCTIYVDSTKGWDGESTGYTDWTPSTLTDAETAVKPKKCFGVYREGSRKAWLVATNEKRGFAIIVR